MTPSGALPASWLPLENVPSAADGVAQSSEDPEDQTDQEHDDADRPDEGNGGQEPDDEKDNAKDDHGEVETSEAVVGASRRGQPTLSKVNSTLTPRAGRDGS
jgi:hypothetical protein